MALQIITSSIDKNLLIQVSMLGRSARKIYNHLEKKFETVNHNSIKLSMKNLFRRQLKNKSEIFQHIQYMIKNYHQVNKSKVILSEETFIYILFQSLNELFSYPNLVSTVNKKKLNKSLDKIISKLVADADGSEHSSSSNSRKS